MRGDQRTVLEDARLVRMVPHVDDAAGGGVGPRVGQRRAPAVELAVEVVEVAERAGEEEVLADVAERPLDLALGLGAIRPAGARHGAVVAEQVDQRTVVDHRSPRILADDGGPHAVVQDLGRDAAHGLERGDVAARHGLQVLSGAEPAPQPAAVRRDHGEQPHRADPVRLVREGDLEPGEVGLGLPARRRLEAALEAGPGGRTSRGKSVTALWPPA